MTTATFGPITVPVTADGFLADPARWSDELAVEIARAEGIPALSDRHWQVIRFVRQEFERTGATPNVRLLAKASGIPVKELYELFPKGPAKLAARIAGAPKPHGCI